MSTKSNIVNVNGGLKSFKSLLETNSSRLVAVHFWADWAPQCQPLDEAINILASEQDQNDDSVVFIRVNAEEEAEISMEFEVAAVPTFIFFGNTKVMGRVEGAKVSEVTELTREYKERLKLMKHIPKSEESTSSQPLKKPEDLNTRLKQLISASEAMLFMKGSPSAPQCGFSRQCIGILDGYNASYGYFDILKDNEVRQGLKEFSKWPTYPQLYVKGELVGGLDILKEMAENDELESMLPKKQTLEERLSSLIKKSDVMVFMKGNRNEPRCGFSRQLIEILKPLNIKYETFDILQDEEVRQGLKSFSNWPTYPQVYAKGDLVGGLDIIKELKECGELESSLKG